MTCSRLLAVALVLAATGCDRLSDDAAVRLVQAYNRKAMEAYRTADPILIEDITGPTEGKKLTALVGSNRDLGLTLDSDLLELAVLRVERRAGEVVVYTDERWYYRNLRIGTGEQVGAESRDVYRMRYHLRRPEGRWVVDEIAFDEPPQVGRAAELRSAPTPQMHGLAAGEHPPPAETSKPEPRKDRP